MDRHHYERSTNQCFKMQPHEPHMSMQSATVFRIVMRSFHAILRMRSHMRFEYADMQTENVHMRTENTHMQSEFDNLIVF